jgi:hypothetical protein
MRATSKSVALLYGFSEGPWHGKKFSGQLRKAGYTITQHPREADIVIAHSGGAYFVPDLDLRREQRLVCINPTYWPGRPLWKRTLVMTGRFIGSIRPGNRPFYQLYKSLHNVSNLLLHFRTNCRIVARAKSFDLRTVITHPDTLLIRTYDDPWIQPNLEELVVLNPTLRIVEVVGEHDACWLNPTPYINLLQ